MAKLKLDIVTPEKIFYASEATMVVIPGVEGEIGVLEGHAPLISTLKPGIVSIYESSDKITKLFVYKGFAEINAKSCTILADEAIYLTSYSKEEAQERYNLAKQRLEYPNHESDIEELAKELDIAKHLLEFYHL